MRSFRYTNRTLWVMCGLLFILVIILVFMMITTLSECSKESSGSAYADVKDNTAFDSSESKISISEVNLKESVPDTFSGKQISLDILFAECESDDMIPNFYTRVYPNDIETPVYAYTDQDGTIKYRSYAKRCFRAGNCIVKDDAGFLDVLITFDGNKCDLSAQSDDLINLWEENPGIVTPELPSFGSIPNNIKYSGGNLFVHTDKNGEETYCIYGSFDGIEYHYYECDEDENMYPGALYLDTLK